MRHLYYKLDEQGRIVPCEMMEWAEFFNHVDMRVVKQEYLNGYQISTVFLGMDHSWSPEGPPVLWETMIFGEGELDEQMERCAGNREQAEAMHERMVERVRQAEPARFGPSCRGFEWEQFKKEHAHWFTDLPSQTNPENPDTARPGSG